MKLNIDTMDSNATKQALSSISQQHQDDNKAETETQSDRLTTSKMTASASTFFKKKVHEIHSKHSGSRKSSEDTTGIRRTRFENSYRLGPEISQRFVAYKIQPKIQALVAEKLALCQKNNNNIYNAKAYSILSRDLADSIRREAKNIGIPRFKILAHVVVGQDLGQDLRVASRCLWNMEYDNSITVHFTLNKIFVVASVYVLYFE